MMRQTKFGSGLFGVAFALTGCLALGSSGCIFTQDDNGDSSSGTVPDPQPPSELDATPARAAIDTDQTITAKPGEGVGLYVEYKKGGHWRLFTTCDTDTATNPKGTPCNFEGFLKAQTTGGVFLNPVAESLEAHDTFDTTANDELHFVFQTGSDIDGLTFDLEPGAAVQLEMYLDGHAQKKFVYWVGDDVLHTGAPTDPVQLLPSKP